MSLTFGWQAARKRLKTAPEVHEAGSNRAHASNPHCQALETAFAKHEDDIEDEPEEPPAPLMAQLEDAEGKRKRLCSEGGFLASHERFAEALKHWEEALLFTEEAVQKAPIYEQMAQVLLLLDRPFDAIRTFETAEVTLVPRPGRWSKPCNAGAWLSHIMVLKQRMASIGVFPR